MAKNEKVNWNSLTKAQLVTEIKKAVAQNAKLLKQIARLKNDNTAASFSAAKEHVLEMFPWEPGAKLPNPFNAEKSE